MFILTPGSTLDYTFDWTDFILAGDEIDHTQTVISVPVGLEKVNQVLTSTQCYVELRYSGDVNELPRQFLVYNRVFTEGGLSQRLYLPIRVQGLGDTVLSYEEQAQSILPNRWIDLDDPYIGMRDVSRKQANGDYLPVAGEAGIGFYFDSDVDLKNAGVSAQARLVGPESVVTLPAAVDSEQVTFVTPVYAFPVPGYYRVTLQLDFPGGGRRKICRMVYVNSD